MAELTDVAFDAKYTDPTTGIYRDGQGAAAITPEDHRSLAEDIAESFHNYFRVDSVSLDPTVSTSINFSLRNTAWVFIAAIAAPYTWTLANDTYASRFTILMNITGGLHAQTFPASFIMQTDDPRWNASTNVWTPAETGKYKLFAEFDGTNWFVEISRAPYS
jgi:hypothetical protein